MYPISSFFADYLRKHERDFIVKAEVDGVEYNSGVLVDFEIENSLTLDEELILGEAVPSKLTIKFRTLEQFPPNARIVPYVALSVQALTWMDADFNWGGADIPWEGGETEWMPLGEFFIDTRQRVNDIWTYTCYDRLIFGDAAYVSQLSYPATMRAVWNEICDHLDCTYDGSVVINPAYMIGAGPAGFTMRQVMMHIASANAACIFVDKLGIVKFRRPRAADQPVFNMALGDYIRVKETNPVKTFRRVVVTYDPEDDLFYEAGEGSEGETMYIQNPFVTQQIVNDMHAAINGYSYQPVSMTPRGFPQLEQGDRITYRTESSVSWNDADIPWGGAEMPWDGVSSFETLILHQVLTFKGGFNMQIETRSVSDQQSEFVVEGSLTEAVNRLSQKAVRYDKPYYGITHSRTEGMVVQREDQRSKLTLNSDVMNWEVDGQSSLYYDAPANRLKFTGTLEGVDGIFTGRVQGGEFVGGSIQIGSSFSVNNAGQMKAVGGEFSGSISASVVNGGNIIGAFINGGEITGTRIQTAAPGVFPRIELNNSTNVLRANSNASSYVGIESNSSNNSPAVVFNHGNISGLITPVGNDLQITTIGGSGVRVNSGADLHLSVNEFLGYKVRLSSWGALRNDSTGQTLQQVLDAMQLAINNYGTALGTLTTAVGNKSDKGHTHNVTTAHHNHGNGQNNPNTGGGTYQTTGSSS